jgi:hypothetical protein
MTAALGPGRSGRSTVCRLRFTGAKTTQDIDLMMSLWDPGMAR